MESLEQTLLWNLWDKGMDFKGEKFEEKQR